MSDPSTRNAALAALAIMLVFGTGWMVMPRIIIAIGNYSTAAAGVVAVLFVAAFFVVFWLRARWQGKRR